MCNQGRRSDKNKCHLQWRIWGTLAKGTSRVSNQGSTFGAQPIQPSQFGFLRANQCSLVKLKHAAGLAGVSH
jgi:hypothetical protein